MLKVVLALGLASAALAAVVVPPALPFGWHETGPVCPTRDLSFTIRVKAQNIDRLQQLALSVSNPKSSEYGNFLTAEQVNVMTAPREQDMMTVVKWLVANNVKFETNSALGAIVVKDKAEKVERLLSTRFTALKNYVHDRVHVRAGEYTLPDEVAAAVGAVFGLHGMPLPPRQTVMVTDAPTIGPADLISAYGVSGVTPSGSLQNRQAVAEFQGQLMNESDLEVFFKMYVPNAPAEDSIVYKYHGGNVSGQGIEAQLDIQYIMGVAPGIKTEFYEQMNSDFCSDLQAWTTLLLSTDDIPLVHSISYGWQGNLTEIGCKDSEVMVVDQDFVKLAARGIAIIFASGDSGSGYAPPTPPMPPRCDPSKPGTQDQAYQGTTLRTFQIPNQEGPFECCSIAHEIGVSEKYAGWTFVPGSAANVNVSVMRRGEPNPANVGVCTIFSQIKASKTKSGAVSGQYVPAPPSPPSAASPLWPSWPASSTWVTSVGATRFHNDQVGASEDAVNQEDHFGSGGGFSASFPQPSWQKSAVSTYFQTVPASTLPDPSKVSYDKNGRATPDVSALGTGFNVISDGRPLPGGVGGTSASAPTFAAIVSLLNEARIQKGKKQLGFLNEFIYQNADAFTDVVLGSDKIGRGGPLLPYGFNCTTGWDPITGVGTPIFGKLLQAALALP